MTLLISRTGFLLEAIALPSPAAPVKMAGVVATALSRLESLTARLEQGEPRLRHEVNPEGPGSAAWQAPPADGEIMSTFDERPISGRASPWGLDFDVRRDGDEAVAIVTMRAGHEGAPGRSHGGIVAAVFDDVFGFVLNIIGAPAFTGELTIRYVAGTPIGVPLECRVRLAGRERRKILMAGELTDAGRLIATAKATFIASDLELFRASAGS